MASTLHDAASRGLLDIIVKIGKDKDNVNLINQKDHDDDTPVLKAVKNAHIEAVVALVAFGADVNIPDRNEKTPIAVAIENRSSVLVQLLCSIGAHVNLSDWFMELKLINTFEKTDRYLLFMMQDQADKMSKFQQKLIKSSIVYVETGKSIFIEELGITINPSPHQDIFLRCMTKRPEYVPSNYCFFGDIFEFQGWNITNTTIMVNLVIPEIPQLNERLSILPLAGKVREHHSLTSTDNDNKVTKLTVDVNLKRQKIVRFAVIATEIIEVFDVPKNGTTITPKMEPDSYINVKPETFKEDLQLQVKFTGTKLWNEDDKSNKCDFLVTNVLNVTSSVDLQPSKDIEIMLPLQTVPADSESVTILVSDELQPDGEFTWRENNAQVAVIKDNKVIFHIRAFKWCVAALSNAISSAKRNASKAIKGEKMMNIFAMLKRENTFYQLVVEFSLLKNFEQNKIKWLREGYSFESSKEESLCRNKSYKISFSGNVIQLDGQDQQDEQDKQDDNKNHIYCDMRKNGNFKIFHINDGDRCTVPAGQVYIQEPVKAQKVLKMNFLEWLKALFERKGSDPSQYIFKNIVFLDIGTQENESVKVDDKSLQCPRKRVFINVPTVYDLDELECSYPVLRKSSLKRLGNLLKKHESTTIGQILHVPDEKIKDILDGQNIGGQILCLWQVQKRPNPGRVNILAQALEIIQQNDLADIVREAMEQETEFNYTYEDMP